MASSLKLRPTAASETPLAAPPCDHDLTVIIPAYNEEQRLPWTLRALTDFLSHQNVDYRVLVADDGSRDATAKLSAGYGHCCSTISLDRPGGKSGKGRAVRTAMLRATGRVVAFTDADLPFALSALDDGFRRILDGECEVVFGARDLDGSAGMVSRRLGRRLATRAFREVVKRLISREVTDTQCGLKLFSRRAAMEIFARTTIDGFAFDTEVVLLTERLGLPFRRIPVTLVNDYGSALSLWRDTLPMLVDVAKLWWRSRGAKPLPKRQIRIDGGE